MAVNEAFRWFNAYGRPWCPTPLPIDETTEPVAFAVPHRLEHFVLDAQSQPCREYCLSMAVIGAFLKVTGFDCGVVFASSFKATWRVYFYDVNPFIHSYLRQM